MSLIPWLWLAIRGGNDSVADDRTRSCVETCPLCFIESASQEVWLAEKVVEITDNLRVHLTVCTRDRHILENS